MSGNPQTVKAVRERVRNLLEQAFPEKLSRTRHIGPEDEFPVVDQKGEMADITPVFGDFVENGWKPKRDPVTCALIGVAKDGIEIGMDVGLGTLEIGFPHVPNLCDHIDERKRILRMVDYRLKNRSFKRLPDYACQPLTVPTREHWSPKGRGYRFREMFNSAVHAQTLSAAAQVHLDVARGEVFKAQEIFLSLSPVLIALNANSPVWGGRLDPAGMLAARQDFWYRFTNGFGYENNVFCGPMRSGCGGAMVERSPSSFEELADFTSTALFLVRVNGNAIECPLVPFEQWCASLEAELSDDEFREAYLNHEGTLWWDARPRVAFGTIEIRPMCQNAEITATHALTLGLVENLDKTLQFARQVKAYQAWRRLQKNALRDGLQAPGLKDIAAKVLLLAKTGLLRRGYKEEELLGPLEARIADGISPGHIKKQIFEKQGMSALLERLLR